MFHIHILNCHILTSNRSIKISPLLIETEEEQRLFTLGEKNSNAKKALATKALRKQTPNDEESDLIHAMWLRQLEYHGESVAIHELYIYFFDTFYHCGCKLLLLDLSFACWKFIVHLYRKAIFPSKSE